MSIPTLADAALAEANNRISKVVGDADDLTSKDVEEITHRSRETVRVWVRDGLLPALRIGSKPIFRRTDVAVLIARSFTNVRALDAFWGSMTRWLSLDEVVDAAPEWFGGRGDLDGRRLLMDMLGSGQLHHRRAADGDYEVHKEALRLFTLGLPAGLDDFTPPEDRPQPLDDSLFEDDDDLDLDEAVEA